MLSVSKKKFIILVIDNGKKRGASDCDWNKNIRDRLSNSQTEAKFFEQYDLQIEQVLLLPLLFHMVILFNVNVCMY